MQAAISLRRSLPDALLLLPLQAALRFQFQLLAREGAGVVILLLVLVVRVVLHGGGELDLGGFSVSALGDNSNKNWGT